MSASSISAVATVRKFVDRINAHDSQGVVALCTPDHIFVDSLGTELSGLSGLEQAWVGYFALFADYRIEIETLISASNLVMVSGWASATHGQSGRSWRIPAAWRAVVNQTLIAKWQVYADNKPVYEILSRDA
jgi:ketosteroid isomerase-like protein